MPHRPGFTLIETLLYTAFVGIIMTGVVLLAFSALTMRSKLRASAILENNVRFALGRIQTLVNEADAITTPAVAATGTTLTLDMPTSDTDPTIIRATDGSLTLSQGTGTAMAMISQEVTISSIAFTRVSSTTPTIRIVLNAGWRDAALSFPSMTVTTTVSARR